MPGLHTGEIDCAGAKLLRNTGVRWLGAFPRDGIPDLTKEKRPCALIVNTDDTNLPGTHWLALYLGIHSVEFFDSYGQNPLIYSLPINVSITHSSKRVIQSPDSNVCGHYCLLFISYRAKGIPFDQTILYLDFSYLDSTVAHILQTLLLELKSNCRQSLCTGQCCKIKCFSC
jgi:hypothetical protein